MTETQPRGFRDGIESVGTGAETNPVAADNVFSQLGLGVDGDAQDFNFGELNERLSKRLFSNRSNSTDSCTIWGIGEVCLQLPPLF